MLQMMATTLLLLLSVFATRPTLDQEPKQAARTVVLEQVPSNAGHVLVAMYADEVGWNDPAQAAYLKQVKASPGDIVVDISDLDPGSYAIAVLHDADDSGGMTSSVFGWPVEAYGFGNDARRMFGPPTFAASRVDFRKAASTTIILK